MTHGHHLSYSSIFTRISRGTKIERGVSRRGPSFHLHFYFSFFFPDVSDTFSVSRFVFNLPHHYRTLTPPICCCSTLPSRCMEQRRMHSQQLTHNAHDAASLDILQSRGTFYPSFPELLDSSKVPQAPHSSPAYVQQQFAPDSGASLEGGRSPPLPYHIHEHLPQQGHPLDPSPPPQQHQPCQTEVYPPFQHDHERPYPMPQGLSHHLSRAPAHSAHMPISPWPIDAFSDNASAQPTALRGGISPYGFTYALRPQPLYPPQPIHRSVPTHAPPEQSQPTTAPGLSTSHASEQEEDRAITDQGQRSRSWGGVGSLDPATGVFSRASDHPRMRTAQACEKCRLRKAKVSIVPPSPSYSLIPPCSLSDQRSALLSLSAPATIRRASGVASADWNANTPLSVACVDPTSPSIHSPQCQMGPRSPPSWRDRNHANAPPPCPPFNAGDCRFGVSSNRSRNKVINSTNRLPSLLPLPHHPHLLHLPQVVGAWVTCPYLNPRRRP